MGRRASRSAPVTDMAVVGSPDVSTAAAAPDPLHIDHAVLAAAVVRQALVDATSADPDTRRDALTFIEGPSLNFWAHVLGIDVGRLRVMARTRIQRAAAPRRDGAQMVRTVVCETCAQAFTAKREHARFCGRRCAARAQTLRRAQAGGGA